MFQFEIVAAILAFVLLVAWFVRLESKVLYWVQEQESLKEEIKSVKAKHDADLILLNANAIAQNDKMWEEFKSFQKSLNSMTQTLGRIEGKLGVRYE